MPATDLLSVWRQHQPFVLLIRTIGGLQPWSDHQLKMR